MSEALRIDGGELPSTTGVRAPRTRLLTAGRFVAAGAAPHVVGPRGPRRRATCRATGPVVMAANHVGWLDGPLLAICAPRPVHALTKQEMFARDRSAASCVAAGQIPLDRFHVDVSAIRVAVRTLQRRRGSSACSPRARAGAGDMASPRGGAAYLALVTGAPVVPVSFLGTRVPGGSDGSLPPRGTRIAMTFGEPVRARQPAVAAHPAGQVAEAAPGRHRRDPADHARTPKRRPA